MRRSFPVALLLLASCTGSAASPGAPASSSGSATARARPSAHFAPAAVTMFVGLDAEKGILAATCERDACRSLAASRPKRFLRGIDTGLVSFTIGRPPSTVRLEIRRHLRTPVRAPQQVIDLAPKTLMSTTIELGPGRYIVTMIGGWRDREARWVFGIEGPSGR